ncbi:MAG: hypothetical protein NVS3B5_19340 [Sphingomicrobium sp.]
MGVGFDETGHEGRAAPVNQLVTFGRGDGFVADTLDAIARDDDGPGSARRATAVENHRVADNGPHSPLHSLYAVLFARASGDK